MRLVIAATHPIQYHAPWYQALAREPGLDLTVLYLSLPDAQQQGIGFGTAFEWDIPLLDGYHWTSVQSLIGRSGFDGFFARRIRHPVHELQRLQADALLLTGWQSWPLIQLQRAARRVSIPCLVRGESSDLKPRGVPVRVLHRWLLRGYRAFLAIGQANRRFYEHYGIARERLFSCPYFVDNRRFVTQAADLLTERCALRNHWGIPEPAICFLFAGKLQAKKRPLDLLDALRRMLAMRPALSVHLLVVGTGELMAEAKRFVTQHRLPVTFAGFLNQTEIARAYVAVDCLVLPSDYGETWGLVVNEAMACGTPAVVSDRVGCGPDLIISGETGERFPFGDTAVLAATLSSLAADPDRLRAMGEQGRARVLADYSVERAITGTMAALHYVQEQQPA